MKKNKPANQRKIAKKLGVTYQYINAIVKGHRIPSAALALDIEEVSGGYWKAVNLRPEIRRIMKRMN